MPLRLEDIANYEPKKFVVKNVTGGTLVIGDINVTLQKDEAQDLLYQNPLTKRLFRTYDQVFNSRDLGLVIVLGKVEVYTENGQITDTNISIKEKTYNDNYVEGGDVSRSPINMTNQSLEKPNIVAFSEKFTNLGEVSGSVEIDLSQGLVYRATITGATDISFTGWPTDDNVAVSCILYLENAGTDVTFSGSTFKFPDSNNLVFQSGGEDRVVFQSFDKGSTVYANLSGFAFDTV